MSDDVETEDVPMAGTLVLFVASVATLVLFWMLRSGPVQLEAWGLAALLWVCGTAITLTEKGGLR